MNSFSPSGRSFVPSAVSSHIFPSFRLSANSIVSIFGLLFRPNIVRSINWPFLMSPFITVPSKKNCFLSIDKYC